MPSSATVIKGAIELPEANLLLAVSFLHHPITLHHTAQKRLLHVIAPWSSPFSPSILTWVHSSPLLGPFLLPMGLAHILPRKFVFRDISFFFFILFPSILSFSLSLSLSLSLSQHTLASIVTSGSLCPLYMLPPLFRASSPFADSYSLCILPPSGMHYCWVKMAYSKDSETHTHTHKYFTSSSSIRHQRASVGIALL